MISGLDTGVSVMLAYLALFIVACTASLALHLLARWLL